MSKILLILLLTVVIAAEWTFQSSSFYAATNVDSAFGPINATGISAVIVSKANYISLRAKFHVWSNGTIFYLIFPDGTQKEVIASYTFEVLLPRTGSFIGGYTDDAPGGVTVTDRKPIGIAVKSNVTDGFFTEELNPDPSGTVTSYWFKVSGQAHILVACYGVAV